MDCVRSIQLKSQELVGEVSYVFPQLSPAHRLMKNKNITTPTTSHSLMSFNNTVLQSSQFIILLFSLAGQKGRQKSQIVVHP